jgi:uracil-DNA glycosylase
MDLYNIVSKDKNWSNVRKKVNEQRDLKKIWPADQDIYNAFKSLTYKNIKVIIIGQDPYYTPNTATGRAFGVNGNKIPPSLININKELINSLGQEITDFTLAEWQKQGVLLINTVLTVEENKPTSHEKMGWQELTIDLIAELINKNDKIILVGLGNYAISVVNRFNYKNTLTSSHPSPLSAYRGFNGSNIFAKINKKLVENKIDPIEWGKNVQK